MRIRRLSGVVMLAIGLGLAVGPSSAGAADTAPPLITTTQTVVDGVGDVINTVTSSLFDNPRADITSASVEYAPGWIRMKVQLKNPIDPLHDDQWSDKSDAEWALDTNGDGKVDYTAEFASENGELYGAVFNTAKPDEKSACDADSASYSPQDGYTLVIDPACIGKPKNLGYAVAMFLATDPKDDKAPLATDRVPDQGFTPLAAPAEEGTQAPTAAAPAPAPGTDPAPVAPKAGAAPAPNRSASGSASAPSPAPAPAPAATGAAPDAPVAGPSSLAHTGSTSERNSLLGLGLMLLGAGLLVMTRPAHRTASRVLTAN